MNIAFDARGVNLYKGTGIGTYTENILRNLFDIDTDNTYTLYWAGENKDFAKNKNIRYVYASKKHKRFFEQYYFPNSIKKTGADIYHVPQNGIGINQNIDCIKVVTIHDLIPYLMPETVGAGYLAKFISEMPGIINTADGIITVSEWSKKDIIRFFPECENKIYVTPLAADSKYHPMDKLQCRKFMREKYNINDDFILYIGGFSKRKNVAFLIEAFAAIQNNLVKDHCLVIAGTNKDDFERLTELCEKNNIKSKVIFTGYIPEEDLPLFYNACEVFVYPSIYEGFGLPPLEAMSCGAPVITSKTTSIPEVVGDAGILIEPKSIEEMKESLINILSSEDIKRYYSSKGLLRSSQFSWKKTALKTLEVYNKLQELKKEELTAEMQH